jgi:hypothetical protein
MPPWQSRVDLFFFPQLTVGVDSVYDRGYLMRVNRSSEPCTKLFLRVERCVNLYADLCKKDLRYGVVEEYAPDVPWSPSSSQNPITFQQTFLI